MGGSPAKISVGVGFWGEISVGGEEKPRAEGAIAKRRVGLLARRRRTKQSEKQILAIPY